MKDSRTVWGQWGKEVAETSLRPLRRWTFARSIEHLDHIWQRLLHQKDWKIRTSSVMFSQLFFVALYSIKKNQHVSNKDKNWTFSCRLIIRSCREQVPVWALGESLCPSQDRAQAVVAFLGLASGAGAEADPPPAPPWKPGLVTDLTNFRAAELRTSVTRHKHDSVAAATCHPAAFSPFLVCSFSPLTSWNAYISFHGLISAFFPSRISLFSL